MMKSRSRNEWYSILDGTPGGHVSTAGTRASYDESFRLLNRLQRAGAWQPGDRVLDVGSGNGRLAISLTEQPGAYIGLEPIADCVEFCERSFRDWSHVTFRHLDIRNAVYNPSGNQAPQEVTYPVDSATIDLVVYSSVFSHAEDLTTCSRNLQEAFRVLKPGGKCWSTWFASPPNEPNADCWRRSFPVRDIVDQFVNWILLHSSEGRTSEFHDQWCVLLGKPSPVPIG